MIGNKSLLSICVLLLSEHTLAGPLMDYIRSYDLNDYALGVSFSVSESPYLAGDNSAYAYPYLTSFRDSAFTDDWFLVSEGNLGFRWISDSGWELGLVGRLQTLGLGNSDAPELRGLDDRNWGLEVAPMIGWRGWPVHINLKTYVEILDRHGGTTSQLAFSLPREYDRGYFIQVVEAIHRSADYTDYYYGVSATEARPGRPEYQAGSSINTAIKVRWGYELTEKWLMSGSFGVEYFDAEISDSPIVDKDKVWSANISLAYNSNIFMPTETDLGAKKQPKLEIRTTAFNDSADSKVIRNADDGTPGDEIDLEDLLGISDNETIFQIDAIYRFNERHRLELGYHELSRSGTVTLGDNVTFGSTTFTAGTTVDTRFDSELLRIGYAYSLMNDAQKELGVMAGVHVTNGTTDISAALTGQREHSDVSTPLPVIGVHGSVELGTSSTLGARIQLFGMEFDRLEGSMIYLNLEWQRRIGDHFSAGLAYNFYATKLESTDADTRGTLETRHHGPALFISANF